MTNNNDTILSVKNLYKLYGSDRNKAIKLKEQGLDKNEIYKKTGVTLALWDVSLDIKKEKSLLL